MPSLLRSVALRVGTILVYCYGAVIAPSIHSTFHRDDHVHVGDSIVYLHTEREAAEERNRQDHVHSRDRGDDRPNFEHRREDPFVSDAQLPAELPGGIGEHSHHHEQAEESPAWVALSEPAEHDTAAGTRHPQPHHHHDDPEHGSGSLWHFGAALNDHLDRTPALPMVRVFAWLTGAGTRSSPPAVAWKTLRLRGPPLGAVA